MWAISSWSPRTSAPRSASRKLPGKTASSARPRTSCRERPKSASMARFQRTTRLSRSSTTMPESRLSRMFSLYSLSPRSSSAFSWRLWNRRPFMIAVAACAASVFRVSTSSLLSGSRPSFLPTPSTAITSPFTRQGKSQARPEAATSARSTGAESTSTGWPRDSRARSGLPAAIRGRPTPVRGTPRVRNGTSSPLSPGSRRASSRRPSAAPTPSRSRSLVRSRSRSALRSSERRTRALREL